MGPLTLCSLYCPIRRGQTHWPYMVLADDRLVETDFDEMVCEVNSPYQNVRIFHSKEKGNVLLLDGDISKYWFYISAFSFQEFCKHS